MIKKHWLWDVKRSDKEVRHILSSPESDRFVHYAALLLSRSNVPKEVFGYLKKVDFCRYWQSIKRRMLKDTWSRDRAMFWDAIYKHLIQDIKMKGGMIKPIRTKLRHGSLSQEIGLAIKELRIKGGMTQRELADKTGVKQQVISKVESGNANPSLQTIEKIKKHLIGDIDIEMASSFQITGTMSPVGTSI